MPKDNYQHCKWLRETHRRIAEYADDCLNDLENLADKMDIESNYVREYFIKCIQRSGEKREI